ncbi:MAG TPA: radical SAM protein [Clostridiales bacterium]|nr:radical SAM protein [Clostridiales bacterium]
MPVILTAAGRPHWELAWSIRMANFPPVIRFAYPDQTSVVSVTGGDCALDCAHCGGHYLRGMLAPSQALARATGPDRPSSWLVSGGCDRRGQVPLAGHSDLLQQLGRTARLILHVGLVDGEGAAEEVGRHATVVALDMVGDRQTAREVMGLDVDLDDYLQSYRRLARHTRVIPHLCLGLHGGELRGERAVLEALRGEDPEEVVFLVFSPTPGTTYQDRTPPPIVEVIDLLAWSRQQFPATPLTLGCMRPRGAYRAQLDDMAVRIGINGVAVPTPAAERAAADCGLTVVRGEECCVLR